MSRVAQMPPMAGRDARMGNGIGTDTQDDVCPVCKSSRYLNANLRLLVNPECYHKMCESCVDRLFSHGPKACPIPGCVKTLRKAKFRKQTFEDIQVEREVDIRRKVAGVFNRREDDFETLLDYNNYLNKVEDITFNLVNKIDLEETEREFARYQKLHQKEISDNASLAQQETLSYTALQKAEKAQARQRREAARREEAEERREIAEQKRDALRRLENGQDPDTVPTEIQGPTLKKRLNREAAVERQAKLHAAAKGDDDSLIKGLKTRVKAEPEAPIDPFGGLSYDGRLYHTLQDEYVWDVLQDAKRDVLIGAGGYDIASFTSRALCEAFAGLGVFVADEAAERERTTAKPAPAGSLPMPLRSAEVKLEDPF